MNAGKTLLALLLVAAISFVSAFAGGYLGQKLGQQNSSNTIFPPAGTDNSSQAANYLNDITINVTEGTYDLAEIIGKKVMPTVVGILTTYDQSYSFGFGWGGNIYTQPASSVGTGFIVDKSGYIVTNSHVVNDGDYTSIEVSFIDGTSCEGKVLWNDSTLDLAVIKVEKDGLTVAELGDSDLVNMGQYAVVIGNPLGLNFERSMAQGIISGLDRTINVQGSSSLSSTTMEGLIQTDAAINSGNSGGPLLNKEGKVIGVVSAKASSGENMGFAIPVNILKPIIQQIIENGSFERVYLGITAIGIEQQSSVGKEALEEYYGSSTGIYIRSVTRGGGADIAGLKEGDVILAVNGTYVGTMNRLFSTLVQYKSGDKVSVTYLRDGIQKNVNVQLLTSKELEMFAE